jgi:hypothetical protein
LLCPIVEVAHQPPAPVGGADDPHAVRLPVPTTCTFAIALSTSATKSARRPSVSEDSRRCIETPPPFSTDRCTHHRLNTGFAGLPYVLPPPLPSCNRHASAARCARPRR